MAYHKSPHLKQRMTGEQCIHTMLVARSQLVLSEYFVVLGLGASITKELSMESVH